VVTAETHRAIEAVWRIESARVIAGLTRIVRDVGVAEELAQDALVIALEKWPETGIPDNPGAWLMGTAKHRAIDYLRRGTLADRKHEDLGREMAEKEMRRRWMTRLAMICCGWSSLRVTRCCPWKLALPLRCGYWAG
jgi:predicted RNA polymerase sigma factor